jgi:hypothetical protein
LVDVVKGGSGGALGGEALLVGFTATLNGGVEGSFRVRRGRGDGGGHGNSFRDLWSWSPTLRQKKGARMGHGMSLGPIKKPAGLPGGRCFCVSDKSMTQTAVKPAVFLKNLALILNGVTRYFRERGLTRFPQAPFLVQLLRTFPGPAEACVRTLAWD